MFSEISITFHGDKHTSTGALAYKGINISAAGVIDIHGKQVSSLYNAILEN